jgi:hypothetical protein
MTMKTKVEATWHIFEVRNVHITINSIIISTNDLIMRLHKELKTLIIDIKYGMQKEK